jgi:nickel transport protein
MKYTSWQLRRTAKLAATLGVLAVSPVGAHTVWLERADDASDHFEVRFGGHAGKEEPVVPAKLKAIDALDADGRPLRVTRTDRVDGVTIAVAGPAALITVHLDNGIHTRPPNGPSVEKPLDEVPGATRATYALKYHKTIVRWAPVVTRAVGQPFEVVPVSAALPRAGEPMRIRVLLEGRPAVGVRVGADEDPGEGGAVTDSKGEAVFRPQPGFNKLWSGRRSPVAGNAKYTELSYEYLLGFWVR